MSWVADAVGSLTTAELEEAHKNNYMLQMTEQGPVFIEDPAVVKHRWKAAQETIDNLMVEIKEQKIAEGLKALGPPPKK